MRSILGSIVTPRVRIAQSLSQVFSRLRPYTSTSGPLSRLRLRGRINRVLFRVHDHQQISQSTSTATTTATTTTTTTITGDEQLNRHARLLAIDRAASIYQIRNELLSCSFAKRSRVLLDGEVIVQSAQEEEEEESEDLMFLSKACISLCEVFLSRLISQLGTISDYSRFWEERLDNTWKLMLESKPWDWISLLFRGRSALLLVENRLSTLEMMKTQRACHAGHIKSSLSRIGTAQTPDQVRSLVNEILNDILQRLEPPLAPPPLLPPQSPERDTNIIRVGDGNNHRDGQLDSLDSIFRLLLRCCDRVSEFESAFPKDIESLRPPSHLSRRWLRYSVVLSITAWGARFLYLHSSFNNSSDLDRWWRTALDGLGGFVDDHLISPFRGIIAQVIQNQHPTVFDHKALEDATESLKHMMSELASEMSLLRNDDPDVSSVENKISNLDISIFTPAFENAMKHPLRNVMFGNLTRILMLQMLRIKIDTLMAMSELDAILASNQLNIYIVATVPSVMLVAALAIYITRFSRWARSKRHAQRRFALHLAEVERVLNLATEDVGLPTASEEKRFENLGLLLLALSRLDRRTINKIGEYQERARLLQDLRELETDDLSAMQKLRVIDRMHHSYAFLSVLSSRG